MLKGNEQGALLASTRVRPVAANPPGELGLESAGRTELRKMLLLR